MLLSLDYLTSLFYYIPKAALAAVIITAVAPLFDAKIVRTLWRVKSMYFLTRQHEVISCSPTAFPKPRAGAGGSRSWEVAVRGPGQGRLGEGPPFRLPTWHLPGSAWGHWDGQQGPM